MSFASGTSEPSHFSVSMGEAPRFVHPLYTLVESNKLEVADLTVPVTARDLNSVMDATATYVVECMRFYYGVQDLLLVSGAGAAASWDGRTSSNASSSLSVGAAGEFGGTTTRYADLLNTIFPDLVKKAGEYAAAPVETPVAPESPAPEAPAPAAPAAPEYLGYNQAPTPPPGTLGAGPGGAFMTLVRDLTLERNTHDAAIRQGLRALLNNPAYQLSPQQIRYINSLITGRYKGNKKY